MDLTWLTISGVLIGILIFSLKVGLGCGLANLSRREVLFIALGYLVISLFMGSVIDLIPNDLLGSILNAGMSAHMVIALLLVALGIMTARSWNIHRHDISRRTFWALSMPCPACLAASFISCSFLAAASQIVPWKIGALVGLMFFVSIFSFSWAFGKFNPTPSYLGKAMIILGLFYLLSMLLIPAYINSLKISFVAMELPTGEMMMSYCILLALMILGFCAGRRGVYL